MKKIVYLALFLCFALTNTSCNSDKKAQVINTFVKTYFPDTEVIANIKDGLDCDVTLSDHTQIGFDGNLFSNYVNRIHGSQAITKIAKDNRGWDIALSNGVEIEFDKRFNVIDFDD